MQVKTKFTSSELVNLEIPKSLRGYSCKEVDRLLDEFAEDYNSHTQEIIKLQNENSNYQNIQESLRNALVAAQETAKEVVASAEQKAKNIIEAAELEARKMIQEADNKVIEITREYTIFKEKLSMLLFQADRLKKFLSEETDD